MILEHKIGVSECFKDNARTPLPRRLTLEIVVWRHTRQGAVACMSHVCACQCYLLRMWMGAKGVGWDVT